jgi:cellulose biosynthesis protein BcsQ
MAYVISCVSDKAGRGKTVLSQAIAVKLASVGASVKILDNDKAGGGNRRWAGLRIEKGISPIITVAMCDKVDDVVRQEVGHDYIVLDVDSFSNEFRSGMSPVSDLIIIITTAAGDDVKSTLEMAEYYDPGGRSGKVLICFNLVVSGVNDVDSARQSTNKFSHDVLSGFLPKNPEYALCRDRGHSLIEIEDPLLLERAEEIIDCVMSCIDEMKKLRLAEYYLDQPKTAKRFF